MLARAPLREHAEVVPVRPRALALSWALARARAADRPPWEGAACGAKETAKPLGDALLKATRWLVAGRGRQSLRTPGR